MAITGGLILTGGCGGSSPEYKKVSEIKEQRPAAAHDEHDHDHDHDHDHVHVAPHGGALVELGDHVANLELVLDPATGKLTGYVLDAHAENPLPIAQPEIEMTVDAHKLDDAGKGTMVSVPLKLVAKSDGEAKEASEFTAQSDELKGVTEFHGSIPVIETPEKKFENIDVHYEPKK
ncbi:MAG TPA: hypothetical protein VHB77_06730 [Planctomycetaceae bacterium]|nr:hypothetical protein [Planctomycetaceae bacterium]